MQTSKFVFLLIIFGAATANGQAFSYAEAVLGGPCPTIKYITNISMPLMVGSWFLPFTTLSSPECLNNEGKSVFAAQYDEATINLDMCCRSATNPDLAVCGGNVGSGVATALPSPGAFSYVFADGSNYILYVLATDQESFSVAYGCKPGSAKSRNEIIMVLSRGYFLNSTSEDTVRSVLERNDVAFSNAKAIRQGPSIPYVPGIGPCGC